MVRYKFTFEYDGTEFRGWQKQPNQRTIEGVVEDALSTLYQQKIDIIGQGRTDSGVHAKAQVAHADLPETFKPERIIYAMKGLLPPDITMLTAKIVDPDFHARFSAISRRYHYCITSRLSPLNRFYCWNISKQVNTSILNDLAKLVNGRHDFINFCVPEQDEQLTTICDISESFWKFDELKFTYTVTGNRFLRHMVRRLVGEMIQSAIGKADPGRFKNLLLRSETSRKAHSAPPHGLVLDSVQY